MTWIDWSPWIISTPSLHTVGIENIPPGCLFLRSERFSPSNCMTKKLMLSWRPHEMNWGTQGHPCSFLMMTTSARSACFFSSTISTLMATFSFVVTLRPM